MHSGPQLPYLLPLIFAFPFPSTSVAHQGTPLFSLVVQAAKLTPLYLNGNTQYLLGKCTNTSMKTVQTMTGSVNVFDDALTKGIAGLDLR